MTCSLGVVAALFVLLLLLADASIAVPKEPSFQLTADETTLAASSLLDKEERGDISLCIGARCRREEREAEQEECEDIMFTLFLDEYPEEVAYTLVCDDTTIWDKPYDSFSQEDAFEIYQESALCVAPVGTCHFTIKDLYGDGLTAAGNDQPAGYFAVIYGAETVAMYDGTSDVDDSKYTELSYCFGPGECPLNEVNMGEAKEDNVDPFDDCEMVRLSFKLDEFPSEVGFKLVCGAEIIWDVPMGTYRAEKQFATFKEESCVRTSDCCTFDVYDSWKDGLTSPQDNIPGGFELTWGGNQAAFYDGSDKDAKYGELSFLVGPPGCAST